MKLKTICWHLQVSRGFTFSLLFFLISYLYFSFLFSVNYSVFHFISECGLKGDLVKVTLDTATGRIVRDESDLPVVQVLYDYKPNEVAVDPILLYYKWYFCTINDLLKTVCSNLFLYYSLEYLDYDFSFVYFVFTFAEKFRNPLSWWLRQHAYLFSVHITKKICC